MNDRLLHFDGPMMVGGAAYPLDEISGVVGGTRIPTGVVPIDAITGGIGPGEVWCISGQSGTGVTALCSKIAAAASNAVDVVLCNGHVPSLAMVRDVQALGASERLCLASWLAPLDFIEANEYGWTAPGVYVIDTWDELLPSGLHALTYTEMVERLRYVRRRAAMSGSAVVIAARTPLRPRDEPLGWTVEALAEVAHVRVELGESSTTSYANVRVRRGPHQRLTFYIHGGEFRAYSPDHEVKEPRG